MKLLNLSQQVVFTEVTENITNFCADRRRRKLPLQLFILMCFNLILAPMVQAATNNDISRTQAYAIAILGIAAFAYSIFLFVVMFQPERF